MLRSSGSRPGRELDAGMWSSAARRVAASGPWRNATRAKASGRGEAPWATNRCFTRGHEPLRSAATVGSTPSIATERRRRSSATACPRDRAPNAPGRRSSAAAWSWSLMNVGTPGRIRAMATARARPGERDPKISQSESEGCLRTNRTGVPSGQLVRSPVTICSSCSRVTARVGSACRVMKASAVLAKWVVTMPVATSAAVLGLEATDKSMAPAPRALRPPDVPRLGSTSTGGPPAAVKAAPTRRIAASAMLLPLTLSGPSPDTAHAGLAARAIARGVRRNERLCITG